MLEIAACQKKLKKKKQYFRSLLKHHKNLLWICNIKRLKVSAVFSSFCLTKMYHSNSLGLVLQ